MSVDEFSDGDASMSNVLGDYTHLDTCFPSGSGVLVKCGAVVMLGQLGSRFVV